MNLGLSLEVNILCSKICTRQTDFMVIFAGILKFAIIFLPSVRLFTQIFNLLIFLRMLYYFSSLGYLELDWGPVATKVAIVSLAATVVESLPISDVFDDNFTVPLCCISVASVLFGF